jgi:hypothetical protein
VKKKQSRGGPARANGQRPTVKLHQKHKSGCCG